MIRLVAAIRATVTVVALLVAVPVMLTVVGGSPLPDRVPSSGQVQAWLDDPLRPQYVASTVRAGAWLIWALLVVVVLAVMVARVRRWRWARLTVYLPGPVQGLAATLLGAATVTTAVGVPHTHAANPPAAQEAVPPSSQTMVNVATATTVTAGHREQHSAQRSPTVTVHPGDTLWDIAADQLGSSQRWKQIYRLNTDRYPRMHGGDHIEPGWTLALPTRAAETAPPPPRPGTDEPGPTSSAASTTTGSGPGSATPPTPTVATPPTTVASRDTTPPSAHLSRAPQPSGDRDAGGGEPPVESPLPSSSRTEAAETQPQISAGRNAQNGVSLTGGSWLDVGLAAAIAAAVAVVWAHRRRRYTRYPLSSDLALESPDLAPMPPVVSEIRRRLHDDSATTPHTEDGPADPAEPAEPTADDERRVPSPDVSTPGPGRPVVPTSTNPVSAVWPSSGLGLTGPGAEPATRGFLTAALADSDPHAPAGHVVLPSTTAATLLGAAAVTLPRTPRLIVTDTLAEALDLLEQQILHRSRLVYAHEADTVTAMRGAAPDEEPTPPLLLLAEVTSSHEHARIAALLAQGRRLDIHGVLLGAWPGGDTIVVDDDGSTSRGDDGHHSRHPGGPGRLAVLNPEETIAVITTLAEAHTGLPQPPTPTGPHQPAGEAAPAFPDSPEAIGTVASRVLAALAELSQATAARIAAHLDMPMPAATAHLVHWEHSGHTEIFRTETGQTQWRLTDTGRASIDADRPAPPARDDDIRGAVPGRSQTDVSSDELETPDDTRSADRDTAAPRSEPATTLTSDRPAQAPPAADTEATRPVAVTVLGEPGIAATDPGRRPRKKALELLVYLVVHDGSATTEAIMDDLMPDAPASKAPERLYTYVSDLRAVMRSIGGPATYVTHPHRRYVLNPDAVDIDLWRMRAAIRDAQQATDPQQRIDALRLVVDLYRGPFADGADYEWAEPYREAIRQQVLDAHLALADALTDSPAAQARILEQAIAHSPYSEHLYQQAMRAHAVLGHVDAIRTLRRALDRALAEIDTQVGDDTVTLADRLIADLQSRGRRDDINNANGVH